MIKVLSFDFDGTLVTHAFADAFWLKGVPQLYAQRHQVPFAEATTVLFAEYEKIGDNRIEWYDPGYWFDRFDLQKDWKKMLVGYRKYAEVYPEVPQVLKRLSKQYTLIVSSNAKREFIDVQLKQTRLAGCFQRVFSSTSDFHTVKKVKDFYEMITANLGVAPEEMTHVGDHKDFDYEEPRRHGIIAYYLDRDRTSKGVFTVHDLVEFEQKIHDKTQK
ncbi:MAG TPA: HAD family hydrolase [Candidatus Thermoplasmatota archaeon]|nr:HAD family hydrolase [Candidatus Thermoplasmatota archaeon]